MATFLLLIVWVYLPGSLQRFSSADPLTGFEGPLLCRKGKGGIWWERRAEEGMAGEENGRWDEKGKVKEGVRGGQEGRKDGKGKGNLTHSSLPT